MIYRVMLCVLLAVPSVGLAQAMPAPAGEPEMQRPMQRMGDMPMAGEMTCTCQSSMMHGTFGAVVLALGAVLVASGVAALGALTLFLVRRSRVEPPSRV